MQGEGGADDTIALRTAIMKFDDIYWHDGVLSTSIVDAKDVRIECAIFSSSQSRERIRVCVIVSDVTDFACTLDTCSLLDNALAGNIMNAKLDFHTDWGFRFKLVLADGYIDVKGKRFAIEAISSKRDNADVQ
jgi:hypothetical protein